MNFAASSLVLILVILPGFCFNQFFYAGDLERISIKRSVVEEVAGIIGISLLIHSLSILIIHYCSFIKYDVDITCIANCLWVDKEPAVATKISDNLKANFNNILYYNLSVCGLGFLFGLLFRKIVRGLRLDLVFRPLRFANPWFYILSGESIFFREARQSFFDSRIDKKIDAVYLDVMVKNDQKSIIYRGLLRDFKLREGSLDSLLISNVTRRYLTEEADIRDKNNDPSIFYEIPGFYLVLLAKEIVNINITYLIVPRKRENAPPLVVESPAIQP